MIEQTGQTTDKQLTKVINGYISCVCWAATNMADLVHECAPLHSILFRSIPFHVSHDQSGIRILVATPTYVCMQYRMAQYGVFVSM